MRKKIIIIMIVNAIFAGLIFPLFVKGDFESIELPIFFVFVLAMLFMEVRFYFPKSRKLIVLLYCVLFFLMMLPMIFVDTNKELGILGNSKINMILEIIGIAIEVILVLFIFYKNKNVIYDGSRKFELSNSLLNAPYISFFIIPYGVNLCMREVYDKNYSFIIWLVFLSIFVYRVFMKYSQMMKVKGISKQKYLFDYSMAALTVISIIAAIVLFYQKDIKLYSAGYVATIGLFPMIYRIFNNPIRSIFTKIDIEQHATREFYGFINQNLFETDLPIEDKETANEDDTIIDVIFDEDETS